MFSWIAIFSQNILLILYFAFLVYVYCLTEKCARKYWKAQKSGGEKARKIPGYSIYLINYKPASQKATLEMPEPEKAFLKPFIKIT